MKKIFLSLVLVLLLVVLVGYFVTAYFMGGIVKAAVNNVGPKATQSKVELASAEISPLSGKGTLSGLTVGNPPGWSDGRAFYLGKVHIDLEPRSIFKDTIVINELTVDQPEFNYETKIVTSNLQDLLKNIEQFAGSSGEKTSAKGGAPKKFIVKKLLLTNGKATISGGGQVLPVPLPEISLTDIGVAEGGVTGNQVAVVVMRDVLNKLIAAAPGILDQLKSGAGLQKTKDAAKAIGDSVKDLFKKKP